MESLYLLIPVALVFCAIAVRLLLWAIDSGQYDDLDKESWRILADEDDADTRRGTGVGERASEVDATHKDKPGNKPDGGAV